MTAEFIATDRREARPHAVVPHTPERAELDRLWKRGRGFLGTELAIMGGAMTWVSDRNLVAAISNAGGFGVIASGSMSPHLLGKEIAPTSALSHPPFRAQPLPIPPPPPP